MKYIVKKSLSGPFGFAHCIGEEFVSKDKDLIEEMVAGGYLEEVKPKSKPKTTTKNTEK